MSKTAKFAVSMPEAEFKTIEAERRRQKKTRSQFVRDAVRTWRQRDRGEGAAGVSRTAVREDPGRYEPKNVGSEALADIAELRRRAIAAAGSFRSAASDLSVNHDKYLEEDFAVTGPADAGGDKKESGAKP